MKEFIGPGRVPPGKGATQVVQGHSSVGKQTLAQSIHGAGASVASGARVTMDAAIDIVQHHRRQHIGKAPVESRTGLELLFAAVVGRRNDIDGTFQERLRWLDTALEELAPAARVMGAVGSTRIQTSFYLPVARLRDQLEKDDHTWSEIEDAAEGDEAAIERLDLAWIDALPPFLIRQIDDEFTESALDKRVSASKGMKGLRDHYRRSIDTLRGKVKARLGRHASKADVERDAEYVAGKRALDATIASATSVVREGKRSDVGIKVSASIVPPPTRVTHDEGRTLARANFMSWGTHVLGSAARVKTHFAAMEPIDEGTKHSAWLHRAAAERFRGARKWFAAQYPGYRFPDTSIGQDLRGRHQEVHPRGRLGHPLGLSLDFHAAENPHQSDPTAQLMLRKFGGGPNRLVSSATKHGGDAAMASEIGAISAAGGLLSPDQEVYLQSVNDGFEAMVATSKRFQASMQPSMPELRQLRDRWFAEGLPRMKATAAADKKLAALLRHKPPDDPAVEAATAARDEARASYEPVLAEIRAGLQRIFQSWVDELQSDLDTARAKKVGATVKDAKYLDGEIRALQDLIDRLTTSPTAVFGRVQKPVVRAPPVMQYLEHGFVRDDAMTGGDVGSPKHVFNAQFVTCMARFGFTAGASWKAVDTMHFDFAEGFSSIARGDYAP